MSTPTLALTICLLLISAASYGYAIRMIFRGSIPGKELPAIHKYFALVSVALGAFIGAGALLPVRDRNLLLAFTAALVALVGLWIAVTLRYRKRKSERRDDVS